MKLLTIGSGNMIGNRPTGPNIGYRLWTKSLAFFEVLKPLDPGLDKVSIAVVKHLGSFLLQRGRVFAVAFHLVKNQGGVIQDGWSRIRG